MRHGGSRVGDKIQFDIRKLVFLHELTKRVHGATEGFQLLLLLLSCNRRLICFSVKRSMPIDQ